MGIDYQATMLVGINRNDIDEEVAEQLEEDGHEFIFGNSYDEDPAQYLGYSVCTDWGCDGTEIDLTKIEKLKAKFKENFDFEPKLYLLAQVS
jgi:hypothetical protein